MKTFEEYKSGWEIGSRKHNGSSDIIYYAVPKDTIDPIGKRITAGSFEMLDWIMEMNYKDEIKDAHLYV
jgi:hypothetical protein